MRPALRSSLIAHRSSLTLTLALAVLAVLLLVLGTAPPPRAAAQPPPPTVTSITPNYSSVEGGTAVVIEGTGFSTAPGVTRFITSLQDDAFTMVRCNSSTRCTGVSATQRGAISSAIRAQVNDVTGPDGAEFAWYNPPRIESLDPPSGPEAGGNQVTLRSNVVTVFPDGGIWPGPVTVHFGDTDIELPDGCQNNRSCTVTAPPGTGTVQLTITIPGGTSNPLQYFYGAAPSTVTSITPNYSPASGGTPVTIEGSGFSTEVGATRFLHDGSPNDAFTMVSCSSDTHCTGVSVAVSGAPGSAFPAAVRAEVSGVAGPPGARFVWYATPNLDSLDPSSGPAAGGSQVTLTGGFFPNNRDFVGPVTAHFGDTDIELPDGCQSVGRCTVTAPPGSGTVQVTITTPGGTSNARDYTYEAGPTPTPRPTPSPSPAPPAIISVTPSSGPYFGGTTVTITGTNLTSPTGPTTVAFGAAPATGVSCSSATSCIATSPPGMGTVSVRVTVGGRSSADTPADSFTYLSPDASAMTLTGRVPAGSSGTLRALVPPTSAGTARTARILAPAPSVGTGLSFWRDESLGSEARSLAQAAPAGTVCGQVDIAAGGSFSMPVFAASQLPGCGTAGAPLALTLNDQPLAAASPVTFEPGGSADLGTLTPGPTPGPTPTPTPTPAPAPMTVTAQVWRQLPPIVSENQTEGSVVPVVGGVVEALVGGTVCGQGVTDSQGRVQVTVVADPPAHGCGRPGRALTFRVNGTAAAGDPLAFQSGGQAAVTLLLPGPMPPARR